MAHRPLAALELPVQCGFRVMAIRRERDWITDVDGDQVLLPGDVLFLEGPPAGIGRLRELAGSGPVGAPGAARRRVLHRPGSGRRRARGDEEHLRGRRRPGLLGAGVPRSGPGRRGPPPRGSSRRDEGPPRAVGAASRRPGDRPLAAAGPAAALPGRRGHRRPGPADGVAHRAARGRPPRSSSIALGDSRRGDRPGARRGRFAGRRRHDCRSCSSSIEPGYTVLAVRRGGRYFYRPRGRVRAPGRRRADRQWPRRGSGTVRPGVRLAAPFRRGHRRSRAATPRNRA